MIVVTGAAGFIGSNLIHALNRAGREDIIAVDDLTDGHKFVNIADAIMADYFDKNDFLTRIREGHDFGSIDAIFHMGACSATTEWDGRYMMENNYRYSCDLLEACAQRHIPLLYASSAAVYGARTDFRERPEAECPLNVYGYSKLLFDQHVRQRSDIKSQVAGFRFFNVYGPREQHKGGMASVAYHLNNQWHDGQRVRLFEGCDGYADGEQRRDFIHVDDVVNVCLWFMHHSNVSGIFNVGTGQSAPFNAIARAVLESHGSGEIDYIPMPEKLKGCYQSFTEAHIDALRAVGCDHEFMSVETGVKRYVQWLREQA